MISSVNEWIESSNNVFRKHGCEFDVSTPPPEAPVRSITVDFEYGKYMCRLVFWESGQGHLEVLDFDSEKLVKNESFDPVDELSKPMPFEELFEQLCRGSL